MATRPDSITPFIAQLLAPLPAHVEQVANKEFNRLLRDDLKDVWQRRMRHVTSSKQLYYHHMSERSVAEAEGGNVLLAERCLEAARKEHWAQCDHQMRIPAPSLGALRWKRDSRKFSGGHPDWEAAIARDEARLGVN